MSREVPKLIAGIALLLIGLSLTIAVRLTAPHTVRAGPGVLYAAPTAQGHGDCSDWDNACTLQTALAQAQNGDEIWVKAGVHYPGLPGQRTATFTLKSGVAVYGGFAGTENNRDQRDWQTNKTILSGDIDRNDNHGGDYINEEASQIVGTNAYHVVTSGGDTTVILDGFIITAGRADGPLPYDRGGGIYNDGSPILANLIVSGNSASGGGGICNYGSPKLTNVTFRGNSAAFGGGIYTFASVPELTDVTFNNNTAIYGGGMYNAGSAPKLLKASFSGNSATYGGGMYNYYSSPMLTSVTFSSNSATSGGGMYNDSNSYPTLTGATFSSNFAISGGGMYNYYSSPTLTSVTFSSNSATNGGGMYNDSSSNPTLANVVFSSNSATYGGGMYNIYNSPVLTNVTFGGNIATSAGGGMFNTNYSYPYLTNVVLWHNSAPGGANLHNENSTPVISYSDVQDCGGSSNWNSNCGWDNGYNIDADPLFVDIPSGNLRLFSESPCVDAGNNLAVPFGVITDLDGNPRFVDIPGVSDTGSGIPPIVDMGAYEVQFHYVDIALTKHVAPAAAPGNPLTFTLFITNTGMLTATGIVLTDTLPVWFQNSSFIATLPVTDVGYTPPYVWEVRDLPPGQSGVIIVSGTLAVPLAAGTYTNTAAITARDDWVSENDMAFIQFTVLNVAPIFTSTPVTAAIQGALYVYTATFADNNNDALNITAPILPVWLALTDHGDGTATLSGIPANTDVGKHLVVLCVTDSGGLTATQSFTVAVANVNDPPFFISTPVTQAVQGLLYTYVVAAADPDLAYGDALAITAPTLPSWLTLVDNGDSTAILSGTPTSIGGYGVVLRATDLAGAFAEQSFTIIVRRYYIFLPLVLRNAP